MPHSTPPKTPPKASTVRLCAVCGRHLQAIGRGRKNGKQYHGDWAKRTMHKQCFKARLYMMRAW